MENGKWKIEDFCFIVMSFYRFIVISSYRHIVISLYRYDDSLLTSNS